MSSLTVPWVTYTEPEVAHVGAYEHDYAGGPSWRTCPTAPSMSVFVPFRVVATLRRIVSHLCVSEAWPVTDWRYVPAEEAARLVASGTRLPLGAVAALVKALALRLTLVIEHGGRVAIADARRRAGSHELKPLERGEVECMQLVGPRERRGLL